MKIFVLVATLSIGICAWSQALAQGCHRASSNAKACPTSGSTLLDDTYPVSSYVISIQGQQGRSNPDINREAQRKVPKEYILKILESYDFSSNSPNFIIPADKNSVDQLKADIQEEIIKSKGKIPERILEKIVHAPAPQNWTWQQDYFESFFDPSTGKPVLRNIDNYKGNRFNVNSRYISDVGSSCGITEGPQLDSDLDTPGGSFDSGEMGGNIEGLPGGFCLTGDNQSDKFALQYCGKAENIVKIDTSWLAVGHVDEVFKVLPTNRPGVPKECNFSLMFASPRKALELLKKPASTNHPVFSGEFLSEGATQEQIDRFRRSRGTGATGTELCDILRRAPALQNPEEGNGGGNSPSKARKAYFKLKDFILSEAYAQTANCEVEKITNANMVYSLEEENSKLRAYNEGVQATMDRAKQTIKEKIYERLPHCRQFESIVDVPNLFHGTPSPSATGTPPYDNTRVPSQGNGTAIFPNPTNSVVAGKDLIISDPQSPLFREYLSTELKSRGAGAKFIDTWDYAHVGYGNIHCSSHSIPYCSPGR